MVEISRTMNVGLAIHNLHNIKALGELFREYGGTNLKDVPFSIGTVCSIGYMLMELADDAIENLQEPNKGPEG